METISEKSAEGMEIHTLGLSATANPPTCSQALENTGGSLLRSLKAESDEGRLTREYVLAFSSRKLRL